MDIKSEDNFNYIVYNAIDEEDHKMVKYIIEKTKYTFTPNHLLYAILQSNFVFCALMKRGGYAVDGLSKMIRQDGCFNRYFQPVIYEREFYKSFDKHKS